MDIKEQKNLETLYGVKKPLHHEHRQNICKRTWCLFPLHSKGTSWFGCLLISPDVWAAKWLNPRLCRDDSLHSFSHKFRYDNKIKCTNWHMSQISEGRLRQEIKHVCSITAAPQDQPQSFINETSAQLFQTSSSTLSFLLILGAPPVLGF